MGPWPFLRSPLIPLAVTLLLVLLAALGGFSGPPALQALLIVGPALIALPLGRVIRNIGLREWLAGQPWRTVRTVVILGFVLLYAFLASRTSLWDRDEPRFAQATWEMLRDGDWLVPHFNGELRPDKPILIYWLMAAPMAVLGKTELAARLPSVLATGATLALLGLIGTWLAHRSEEETLRSAGQTGSLAMLIFAATPLSTMMGTAATADAVMLLWIVASLAVVVHAFPAGLDWRHTLLLGLFLGLAQLTKGPVGLAIPVLTVGLAAVLARQQTTVHKWLWPLLAAIGISLALFLAWALPANAATDGEFARAGIGRHVVHRMTAPMESHGGNWFLYLPYYVPVVLIGLFPWTLYLGGSLSCLLRRRLGTATERALLWGWLLPTFVLMSVVATKLPHYVWPIWPGLALLIALFLRRLLRQEIGTSDYLWLHRGLYVAVPVGLLFAVTLIAAPLALPFVLDELPPLTPLRSAMLSLGLLVLALTLVVAHEQYKERIGGPLAMLGAGMLACQVWLGLAVLPQLESLKLPRRVAQEVRGTIGPERSVTLCDFTEPSLIFYLDRPQPVAKIPAGARVQEWARRPDNGVLLITAEALQRSLAESGSLPLRRIGSVRGFNYVKGEMLEIVLLERTPAQGPPLDEGTGTR